MSKSIQKAMTIFFRIKQVLMLFVLSLSCAPIAQADVFTYIDEYNKTHYVDGKDRVPEQYRQESESIKAPAINKVTAPKYAPVPKSSRNSAVAQRGRNTVEIFVADWCSYCRALESYLIKNRIDYKRYDIENDPVGVRSYNELGRGGIPITRIGSTIIRGFDPEGIEAELKRRR